MYKYLLTVALAIAAAPLSAQVGIGTKNPEGALDVVAEAQDKDGKKVEAALVLPRVSSVTKVVNLQEGKDKPSLGSLVFDQANQCLRYFFLKEKTKADTGEWSKCIDGKETVDADPTPNPNPDDNTPKDPLAPITFKTCGKDLTYGKIKSEKTGRIWLDRNLGATRPSTNQNDRMARGSLYQWGRESDGHECVDWSSGSASETTAEKATSDKVGHGKFITGPYRSSWKKDIDPDPALWQKDAAGNIPNNPCPKGFRVPTLKEFRDEVTPNSRGIYMAPHLKLTPSTYRGESGTLGSNDLNRNWYGGWAADTSYENGKPRQHYVMIDVYEGGALNFYLKPDTYLAGFHIRCINDQ